MNDANRNKKQSRWQELAEDLGLIEGTTESAAPVSAEPKAKATPEPRIEREEPAPREQPAKRVSEPVIVVETVVEESTFIFESVDAVSDESEPLDTPPIQGESTPDQLVDEAGSEGAPSEGGGSSRSSSRRRRRRRSSKKKKEPTGEGAEVVAQGEDAVQVSETADESPLGAAVASTAARAEKTEDDNAPQRGRQRTRGGRRRREPEPEVVQESAHAEDEVHESGGNVGLDEDGEDDEVVNYSNWTVPPWKDLIASLYRPER